MYDIIAVVTQKLLYNMVFHLAVLKFTHATARIFPLISCWLLPSTLWLMCFCIFETGYSPCWPGACYVDQAVLEICPCLLTKGMCHHAKSVLRF